MEKTVLVTGGARGIGRATALLLAGRGYRVAVADLARAADKKTNQLFLKCDVSEEAAVRACDAGAAVGGRYRNLRREQGGLVALTGQDFVIDGGMTKKMIYV